MKDVQMIQLNVQFDASVTVMTKSRDFNIHIKNKYSEEVDSFAQKALLWC